MRQAPCLCFEPYNLFAWFYDRHWAEIFAEDAAWAVEALILPNIPAGGRLLDLCCGAGHLAAELCRRGYRVTGLDRSGEMLRHAKARAPGAELVRADARAFALGAIHDASVSLFDSLNHILDPGGLVRALTNVRRALRSEALLLFDVNSEVSFRERWVEEHEVAARDGVCFLQGAYDPRTRLGRYQVRLEGRGPEAWRRAEFELVERCHTEEELRDALFAAGFTEAETYDAERDLEMPDQVGRVFYLARAHRSKFGPQASLPGR